MKNVVTRAISGAIYVAIILAAILSGAEWYIALTALLAILGMVEFFRINANGNTEIQTIPLDILGGLILIVMPFLGSAEIIVSFLAYLVLRFTLQLFIKDKNPIFSLGKSVLAQMYIALPLATSVALYCYTGYEIVLSLFLFIWINDTGAFCVGTLFGKHRLFERISPKKSWEGFWGGLLLCIIVAFILGNYGILNGRMDVCYYTILGALVSIFATLGDLIESMIKRCLGIKDSGNMIPGHGGILDRIDSLLLVSPAVLCYVIYLYI